MCQDHQKQQGPIFGLETSRDLYEKLKVDSARLKNDLNTHDVFNFLVTAWHLYHDWSKAEGSIELSKQKRAYNKLPSEMKILLEAVRDIVNGSKHFYLDSESSKKRIVQEVLTGKEVGVYAWLFSERMPAVNANKGGKTYYFSIRTIHNLVMRYFEWVFDDLVPVKSFPVEIVEAIKYCNIAERGSVARPQLLCDSP